MWLYSFFNNYPSWGRVQLALFDDLIGDSMATDRIYHIRGHYQAGVGDREEKKCSRQKFASGTELNFLVGRYKMTS